ncbi:hypothetical protein [Pseudoxanthomonas jiangsuensis]|uniref:hypothetical protein n=1 Tax=Pseudoxanthomonas jiangsuensis TaxID=619688 RepID=UPI001391D3A9|nr:hypothetical protein [Pseudoxanthomonas jiangsuensis]
MSTELWPVHVDLERPDAVEHFAEALGVLDRSAAPVPESLIQRANLLLTLASLHLSLVGDAASGLEYLQQAMRLGGDLAGVLQDAGQRDATAALFVDVGRAFDKSEEESKATGCFSLAERLRMPPPEPDQ